MITTQTSYSSLDKSCRKLGGQVSVFAALGKIFLKGPAHSHDLEQ